jgi:ABC-type dipeptide/oligopeptide/nickel transport system permease component
MLETLSQDCLHTARAKGISEKKGVEKRCLGGK